MSTSSDHPATGLVEQPVIDLFSIQVYHPTPEVAVPGLSMAERAGSQHVIFAAHRRADYRTNSLAATAVRDVLTMLDLLPSEHTIIILNGMSRFGLDDDEIRRQMLIIALAREPQGALAAALLAQLPFTLDRYVDYPSEQWLEEARSHQLTDTAIILMLAWMIYSRTVP